MTTTARPRSFASRAFEAEQRDLHERAVNEYRQRRNEHERRMDDIAAAGVFPQFRASRTTETEYIEEEETAPLPPSEQFPRHGKRRYSTEPDAEGWRIVTRYLRKKPKMSKAERDRKARAEILGEDNETASDDDIEMHGDLADRSQRRDFY